MSFSIIRSISTLFLHNFSSSHTESASKSIDTARGGGPLSIYAALAEDPRLELVDCEHTISISSSHKLWVDEELVEPITSVSAELGNNLLLTFEVFDCGVLLLGVSGGAPLTLAK